MVGGHEELGVAECLQWTDAQDDVLAGLFSSIDLRVELIRLKQARLRFYSVPICSQSNDREGMLEEGSHRRLQVQSERLDLRGAKADSELGRPTRLDRRFLPAMSQRSCGSLAAGPLSGGEAHKY